MSSSPRLVSNIEITSQGSDGSAHPMLSDPYLRKEKRLLRKSRAMPNLQLAIPENEFKHRNFSTLYANVTLLSNPTLWFPLYSSLDRTSSFTTLCHPLSLLSLPNLSLDCCFLLVHYTIRSSRFRIVLRLTVLIHRSAIPSAIRS